MPIWLLSHGIWVPRKVAQVNYGTSSERDNDQMRCKGLG